MKSQIVNKVYYTAWNICAYNYYMNDKALTLLELDNLINRLITEKKGNDVKMSEQEIKSVCVSAR